MNSTHLRSLAFMNTTGALERLENGISSTFPVSGAAKTVLDDNTTVDMLTTLGGTTTGQNLFTLPNPNDICFPRINANNTISALNAADFRTAIGAQPLDQDLTDIAALTTTAYGRGLLTLADSSGMTIQSGTWTPAYLLSISGSVTPSTAAGFWWQIGRLVYATGYLVSSGVSSPSGEVRITLPFPVTSNKYFPLVIGQLASWGGSVSNIDGYISSVLPVIVLVKQAPSAVTATVKSSDLATGDGGNVIRFSVLYEVD